MPIQEWCGRPYAQCNNPCALDESIPCSPDCELLKPDGSRDRVLCEGCDAYLADESSSESIF